jgi:hypothetical protein
MKNKVFKNILLYFILIVGYVLIHVINIEEDLFPKEEGPSKSKIDFIYQQF